MTKWAAATTLATLVACASEPRGTHRVEPQIASAAPPLASSSTAAAMASSRASAKPAVPPELTGVSVEPGASRADKCAIQIVARGLYDPRWLFASPDGRVFVVDPRTTKKGDEYEHRTRISEVSNGSAKPVADLLARTTNAAFSTDAVALSDSGAGEIALVSLTTGKRTAAGPPAAGLGSLEGELLTARVGPNEIEISTPAAPRATLAGAWDADEPIKIAASASHLYFYVFPRKEDSGSNASIVAGRFARAPRGGNAEVLGSVHIATELAAGGGFVFAGSLTGIVRFDERNSKWERPSLLGGVEMIAADAQAAAWTNADSGTVVLWPHGEKPFVACEGLSAPVGVALTKSHVYFSAMGSEPYTSRATVGRFPR